MDDDRTIGKSDSYLVEGTEKIENPLNSDFWAHKLKAHTILRRLNISDVFNALKLWFGGPENGPFESEACNVVSNIESVWTF